MANNLSFSAAVANFANLTNEKIEAVFKESVQEVFAIAQRPKAAGGRMPVKTGFLRNSLRMSINGAPGPVDGESYILAVAGLELGDIVEGEWTAKYAAFVEYGTYKMAGSFFALAAAQQWSTIVAKYAEQARNT